MRRRLTALSPLETLGIVALVYLVSTFVHAPFEEDHLVGLTRLDFGRVALARPTVLSGDSPHYLAVVNSILDDRDLDLSNNYRQARAGGSDLGWEFRGRDIDAHADRDSAGRLVPTHPVLFPIILAVFSLPLAGSPWVESWCIWLTMAAGLSTIFWLSRQQSGASWALLLAFATPLWCYSRDIWVEPWIALFWIALIRARSPWIRFSAGLLGTMIKYPFALVPLAMGVMALWKGDRKEGTLQVGSGILGLVLAILSVQWLFRDVDHFSLFHSGVHASFDLPFDGIIGLLLSPENGILLFFPVLVWGFSAFKGNLERALPLAVFFLVHAAYSDWMGGTGFSSRYLVPILPIWVALISEVRPSSSLFRAALIYSTLWGIAGGLTPAIVYDRSPWGAIWHVIQNLANG